MNQYSISMSIVFGGLFSLIVPLALYYILQKLHQWGDPPWLKERKKLQRQNNINSRNVE
jgi:hypothetical protein